MNFKFLAVVGLIVLVMIGVLSGVRSSDIDTKTAPGLKSFKVQVKKELWYDSTRMREIPVAMFLPEKFTDSSHVRLVIFNHGYGANYPKNYTNYSYLTSRLASAGYWVISIQHELKNDSLLPMSGEIAVVRKPFWERGMQTIRYVLNKFKLSYPNVELVQTACIGHSNGGDMSVYTATNFPNLFDQVITLDHLRVPIPLGTSTRFTTLRSSDKQADPGVLPEKETSGITVVQLKKITHNAMNDEGSRRQHKTINQIVLKALRD